MFFNAVLCYSQEFEGQKTSYRFDNWTTDNGLPQNSVYSITQTRDGYLWFTTLDGLVRFDGLKFTIFDKIRTKGIESNRFTTLFEDRSGVLWIGSEYGGLTRYENGTFETVRTKLKTIRNIQLNESENLTTLSNGEVFHYQNGKFERETNKLFDKIEHNYYGKSGTRWVLNSKGIHQIKNDKITTYPVSIKVTWLSDFIEDNSESLWFSDVNNNFYQLNNGTITLYTQNGKSIVNQPLYLEEISSAIVEDKDGNIWAGRKDLAIFNRRKNSIQILTSEDGVSGDRIRSILNDREGNIWIGTGNRGIFRISPKFITTLSKADGLKSDNIYPILEDSTGNIWIGADNLICLNNGKIINYEIVQGLNFESPQAFYEDSQGRIWEGFYHGIGYFQNGKYIDLTAITGEAVYLAIYEDHRKNFWFGTDKGIIKYKDGKILATFNEANGSLLSNEIKDFYEDKDGVLWVATYGGLVKIVDDKTFIFTEKDGLSGNRIRTITGERDGTLWLGTYDSGLSRFKDGRFTNYTTANGLFNNGVFRILEDAHKNFWMNSNQGIYRVSKQQLNDFADGKISSITSIAYGKEDGIISTEGNGGRQPAGFKARDGKLWFPTQQGIVIVNPEAMPFNPNPPPVVIESVKIDNKIANLNQEIHLNPRQSAIEITYTGLSLIKSEQIRFRYKLEGLDEEWTEAGTRRSVYYAHLPAGEYVFKVIAANSDGVWNEIGTTISFKVVPPFWRTWWFFVLVILSLIGITVLFYQRRLKQFKREKSLQENFSRRLIESQENERKRIARELHDSLSQNLFIIKNRVAISLSSRQDTESVFEQIEEIAEAVDDSLEEVREIAQNLRPPQIDRLGLTKAIHALAKKTASPLLSIKTDLDKIDEILSAEMEINLYRIIQESFNNIIKHSEATKAKVSIKKSEKFIEITVSDNGKGFNINDVHLSGSNNNSGFGLMGIYERSRILGNVPIIDSIIGKGTKIYLKIVI